VVCFYAVNLKSRLRYDDSLDVVGVHMVGGIVGALLTGLLASTAVNAFSGSVGQLLKQAAAVGVTLGFSFVATLAILKMVDALVGVRVSEDEEIAGLDISQHSEVGYTFGDRGGTVFGSAERGIELPAAPAGSPPERYPREEPHNELEVVRGENR
jgi:ammonium transporter, Amt family